MLLSFDSRILAEIFLWVFRFFYLVSGYGGDVSGKYLIKLRLPSIFLAFKNYSFADRILALMEPMGLVRSYGQSESYKRGFGKYIIEVGFTE